jgi:hypothetical protein
LSLDLLKRLNCLKKRIRRIKRLKPGAIYRHSVLILFFFTINILVGSFACVDSAQSADLLSSYNILKNQYPNYINKIIAGGASEAQIESFLIDLDDNVRHRGELNEANFNNMMYEALQEVITDREHRTLFKAMLSQFKEEIDYTIDTHTLHSNLVPLRNAVKDSVLGKTVDNNPNSSPGGGGPGIDKIPQEIEKQLKKAASTIQLSISSNTVTLKGDIIQKINNSNKNLELSFGKVKLSIPPGTVNISNDLSVSISVRPLDKSMVSSSLQRLSEGKKLLGKVIDIKCRTEGDISGLNLQKAIGVTLSYSDLDLSGIDETLLDAYYYDESKNEWIPQKGTVDRANKTLVFSTTHFSKYALIASDEKTTDKLESTNQNQQKSADNDEETGLSAARKFTDLNNGHWAAAEIGNAINLGLAYGVSPTQFAPDRNITRAEFAALLTRAIGIKNTTSIQSRFSDVTTDSWYFNAVNGAAEAGLVSGYTLSTFAPDDLITREQMAVMISRALAYKGKQVKDDSDSFLANFKDRGGISSWALQGVNTVVQLGIVKGRSADTFAARQNATRAEATAMILRTYKQL